MLRFKTGLNYGWRYTPDYSPKKSKNENFDSTIRPVDVPHNSGTSKYSYFTGEDESKIVQYSKLFVIPDEMEGKRVILHFDGVMSCAAVFVNEKAAFAHKGGFTGFSEDITDLLTDSENKLTVIVDSTERADTPPYGAPVDFLSYGGIYRDVWIEGVPAQYIKDTFINPMLTEKGWKLDITGEIGGEGEGERKLTFALYDGTQRLGACQYRAEQPNFHGRSRRRSLRGRPTIPNYTPSRSRSPRGTSWNTPSASGRSGWIRRVSISITSASGSLALTACRITPMRALPCPPPPREPTRISSNRWASTL